MTKHHKKKIIEYIKANDPEGKLVKRIEPNSSFSGGEVEYEQGAVLLHRGISQLGDEEYVRAYLFVHLVRRLGYRASPETIEFEREYSIGRPGKRGKGARVDIVLRYPQDWPEEEHRGRAFLFVECKAPQKYDADRQYLKGQVFDLARQEEPRPRYGVYYTTETGSEEQPVLDRAAIVDLDEYTTFEAWDDAGQPATDLLPSQYELPERIRFANVDEATQAERPLRTDVGRAEFERLRGDLHNIVWGGGGTNNNDVFVVLVRLFLCRVYDENETAGGAAYRFQRHARTDGTLETPDELVERMSALFDEAAQNYLGYSVAEVDETTAFERKKVAPSKIAFVVEQLQGISLTRNTARGEGDTLGEFFEGIVAQDFTQSKGQFFTHVNLVHFCLKLAGFGEETRRVFLEEKDEQGRPRLPYVIDPSAGSGTFIVESMKAGTEALTPLLDGGLTNRQREFARLSFGADSPNAWAREYIYGIEPNADLGLATKVNMILHGDGSTNVFVTSGLLPFVDYASAARNHVLGASKSPEGHPYPKPLNESFDFIFTNPPFSVDLSDEEKRAMGGTFDLATSSQSEALFVERWYQLLREGGRVAVVLPESVLDTSTNAKVRLFLFERFRVEAVVALPYVAFKPFTSTKTCVLLAQKRPAEEVKAWRAAWKKAEKQHKKAMRDLESEAAPKVSAAVSVLIDEPLPPDGGVSEDQIERAREAGRDAKQWVFGRVASEPDLNHPVFMAEPEHVGYKRRKGLEDLVRDNDLVAAPPPDENTPPFPSVLARYQDGYATDGDARFGFWVRLSDIAVRPSLRCDPKYHLLWTLRRGRVFEDYDGPLATVGSFVEASSRVLMPKGPLDDPLGLIELADVEARTSTLLNVTEVDELGSDKVIFGDADLAISKLEPYLGKVLKNDPAEDWVGSTEWLPYNITDSAVDVDFVRYLLLLPEMLQAYRCLQSGKRHARFTESDFLDLRVPSFPEEQQEEIARTVRDSEISMQNLKAEIGAARDAIDKKYFPSE